MKTFTLSHDSKLEANDIPICPICGKRLYKERIEELGHCSIIYFFCKTILKKETKTEEAQYCKGRYHILVK